MAAKFTPNFSSNKIAEEVSDAMKNETSRDKVLDAITSEEQATVLKLAADNNMPSDDPAWLIIHALNVIGKAPEIAAENVAKTIADEISKTRMEFEKINTEAKTAAAESVINTIRAIDMAIEKPIDKLKKRLEKTIIEISNEVQPSFDKWTIALIFFICISLFIGGYFLGSKSVFFDDNTENKILAQKWRTLTSKWSIATKQEQDSFKEMMARNHD